MGAGPDVSVMISRRVSTVVLTGAGFSKDAGLPLTWELVPRGRELSKIRFGIEFVSLIDELTQEILQEPMGDEIEAILTRLKVLEFYSDKYSTKVKGSPEEQNYIWRLLQQDVLERHVLTLVGQQPILERQN